jgi:hypothetical protein
MHHYTRLQTEQINTEHFGTLPEAQVHWSNLKNKRSTTNAKQMQKFQKAHLDHEKCITIYSLQIDTSDRYLKYINQLFTHLDSCLDHRLRSIACNHHATTGQQLQCSSILIIQFDILKHCKRQKTSYCASSVSKN